MIDYQRFMLKLLITVPYFILCVEVQNMAEVLREGGGFNLMISDALPLDREIQDRRHRECKLVKTIK